MWIRRYLFVLPVLVLALLFTSPGGQPALAAAATAEPSTTQLLLDLNQSLKSENESLKTLNEVLRAENEALKHENELLRSQLDAALRRLQELEAAAGQAQTVEGLAAELRTRVFRVDVYDYGGRLIATGSAVAVKEDQVVTNYHVVEEAWSAELVTEAGDRIPVTGMTAFNEAWDLAVLQVSGRLQPVQIRTSPARVGEDVVAIGSPIGLTNTVSTGIVSARRTLNGLDLIQVSAPISHGSSGGGLFDRQGQLIGITFAYLEGGQNLNFAIPTQYVQQVLAQAGPPRDLPGVARITPKNLVTVLYQSHPVMIVGGYEVELTYALLPDSTATSGEAPDILWILMDNDAWFNYLQGMLSPGTIMAHKAEVEAFVQEVAHVVSRAYPDLDVTVVLVYFGQYSAYPAAYDADEITFDYETGSWLVFHPELVVRQFDGEWASLWLD